MKEILMRLLGQRSQWFTENVFFISWGKYWKGVYLHFIPFWNVRVFLWGMDWRKKAWKVPRAFEESKT